tara:strand:- start:4948 stop:5877 length:930 start_codon:yes stop_codon:yes gene_type:complete
MRLMLHDNYKFGMSDNGQGVQWPPISFDKFKPSGRGKTLDHYYLTTTGCKKTLLGQVLKWVAIIGGTLLAPFTAGASAAAGAAVGAAIGATSKLIGPMLNDLIQMGVDNFANQSIEDMAKGALDKGIEDAKKDAKDKWFSRANTDSSDEKGRIINAYRDRAAEMKSGFLLNVVKNGTLSQLKAWKVQLQKNIDDAQAKCNKSSCDTAGCRNVGPLKLRMQYCDMLIAAMEGANATTIDQYKINTQAAYAQAINKAQQDAAAGNLPVLDREQVEIVGDIKKGKEVLVKEKLSGIALPAIILGALFFSSRK